MGMEMPYVCKNGEWTYDMSAQAEKNKCDKEGDTKTESMMGMEMKYVCKDGQWSMDMSNMDFGDFGGQGGMNWGGAGGDSDLPNVE